MVPKPFFSVIVPTFNRAEKLKHTILSVLDQTFEDFELLVMDDGSRDNTQEIVLSFGDSRIRYEWTENSGGPAAPRNRGIDMAQAEWVCFLDADDIWYPMRLKTVHNCIQKNPGVEIFCNNEIFRDLSTGKTHLLKYGPYENDFYRKMLVYGNRVSTSTVTVLKSFLNQHNLRFNESKEYVALEDYDLWLHIALYGGRFYFVAKSLGEYIIDNDNISLDLESVKKNRDVLLRNHVFEIQTFEPNKQRLWRVIQSRLALAEAKTMLLNGNFLVAVGKMITALLRSPRTTISYFIFKIVRYGNSANDISYGNGKD